MAEEKIKLTKLCLPDHRDTTQKDTVRRITEETVNKWLDLFIANSPDEKARFMLGIMAEHKEMGCPMKNRDDLHPVPRLGLTEKYKLSLKKVLRDIWSIRETEKQIKRFMDTDIKILKRNGYKAQEAYEIIAEKYNWNVQSVKNKYVNYNKI
jgi:hypothetical protein